MKRKSFISFLHRYEQLIGTISCNSHWKLCLGVIFPNNSIAIYVKIRNSNFLVAFLKIVPSSATDGVKAIFGKFWCLTMLVKSICCERNIVLTLVLSLIKYLHFAKIFNFSVARWILSGTFSEHVCKLRNKEASVL